MTGQIGALRIEMARRGATMCGTGLDGMPRDDDEDGEEEKEEEQE